ncbi:hypothetical protein KIM372_16040 [Bombiscardovia nodaiensis]|uniref:Uncharacterized protein n=1 Tax=Bombiscardovia nodaiensis TaxID=2932181 RepID=A0ABM8B9X8_9BIFI|nr:hypothetical protein KIM372_16040 [Bombiscardovia nodaiensis]
MKKWNWKNWSALQKGAALVSAVATLLALPVGAAFAGGGGGSDDGDGSTPIEAHQQWSYRDNNDNGFGGADMASITAALADQGVSMLPTGVAKAQKALNEANANCLNRFNAAHADQVGQGQCRVVAVGTMTGPNKQFSGMVHHLKSDWMNNWISTVSGKTYSNHSATYQTNSIFADDPGMSVDKIADQYTSDSTTVVVIMLNQYEPKGVTDYHMTVQTAQQGGFALSGGVQPVSDLITAHASTSVREDVDGTSTLTWHGYPSGGLIARSKPVRLHNDGQSAGPAFTPADFGWQSWPAGHYGFSLDVPKQGQMDAAVSVGEGEADEFWDANPPGPSKTLWNADNASPITDPNAIVVSGVPYVGHVSAQTAGSGSFWLYDHIHDPDVFIGAKDHDDLGQVRVVDEHGVVQAADVFIDRSQAGEVTVKAHPTDWAPKTLTLEVPVYPKATGRRDLIKDDSQSCWSGDGMNCQAGDHREINKTPPAPDKVWTVDESGALVASDPGHTNNAGKDNKTFIPGSPITAVVNGRIPAGLTGDLEAYELTDDWTNAAPYVDFTDVSKTKVYVDGVNRTGDFTLSIQGTKTIARAKPSMLRGTAHLSADKIVKLVITGKVKDVSAPNGQRFTNSGSEKWGDEGADTNIPGVFVRTPGPDKVWVLDTAGGLNAQDEGKTNAKGKDSRVFVPGDAIASVVNGKLPQGLAVNLSNYAITDDWAAAAQYVDFSDASKARVYINGIDYTGDFSIAVSGTKTIATAKPSILNGTADLPADKIVKLIINGMVKDANIPDGVQVTNSGSETWGDKTVPSNDPPVFVRSPKPNKVWVLDQAGGLAASDPNGSNNESKDNRVFVPGDPISSVVNGKLPKGLATNLDTYKITDDWTGAAQYIDFTDASKAHVYVDGVDRTGDFDIQVQGTKTIATAKAAILNTTENLPADKTVKLIISGSLKNVDVPEGAQFTNAGSEQWNKKTVPSNEPPAFVRSPKPDKVWVLDAQGALSAADPNHTNKQGVDTKVFLPGDEVGGVVNGRIPHTLAKDLDTYSIADDWSPAAQYVDFTDASKARVYIDGVDRTGDFIIQVQGTVTIATAKAAVLNGTENLPADKSVKLYIGGTFKDATRTNGKLVQLTNKGYEQWNRKKVPTNEPPVFVWTPNPDKSWVALENGDPMSSSEDYKLVIDPTKTNQTGADDKAFRQGDRVAAAVNATMPAHLARVPNLVLSDDWQQSARIVSPEDVSHIRVYDQDASTAEHSTIAAIDASGRDVTSQFTVSVNGTVATATAKPAYAQGLQDMSSAKQITMLVPFNVTFDPAGIRKDYGKAPGDQLDACKNPDGSGLTNKGNQQAGHAPVDTNQPAICLTVPSIHKDVIGEASQGGDQDSVDGKRVFPGQKVEYTVKVDPLIPANDAYEITEVAVSDTYDPQTVPDKQTLEIHDLNTGRVIPRSQWTGSWDDNAHSFVASFAKGWVSANWPKGSHPRILLRFEARVKEDAPTDHVIDNQAWLTINNSVTPSNQVHNQPPTIKPGKEDTQKSPSVNIDGKTALLGDHLYYRINIDASDLANTAYKVQRLGAIDAYDQEYLKLDEHAIQVLDPAGKDVTAKLNIQVKDGIVYAFFKTVDTQIPATGETVKGDPQPKDLKAYSTQKLDPLKDPAIDQSLLGKKYQLVLPVTVVKVTDGYTVKNTAKQITNSREDITNTVANPLKPINPSKDVVIDVGGESVNHQKIYLHSQFLYRLDSSVLPKHRAYPEITDWSIVDNYDKDHDKPTGQWAVYANRDLIDSKGKVLAQKGERIAGAGFDRESNLGKYGITEDLFTYSDTDGQFTITASPTYLRLVSSDEAEQAWSAYVQFTRYQPAESVKNWFRETLNGVQRPSNEVETKTPHLQASIAIEKFDRDSGPEQGNRNQVDEALEDAKDGTVIIFRITNTGELPVTAIELSDQTIDGTGQVRNIAYPQGFDQLVLKPGEFVDVQGELQGVEEGGHHTDRAGARAKPVEDCPVIDDDPWDDKPGERQSTNCTGEEVVAQPDDWNGKRPDPEPVFLPMTGASVVVVCLLGVSLFGASLPFMSRARLKNRGTRLGQHIRGL